ncbi:MAG: aspartate-semialdehyde dehydrogenase [Anaerolineales bacterium]|nr:aspartate-semialdehyde dehydrogenase [Anaerolineales bacterium]
MEKIPVSILGATGMVGQRFVSLLDGHPWFRVAALTGSDRSIGKTYGESCRWALAAPMPEYARAMIVQSTEPDAESALAFSALPSDLARKAEPLYARAGKGICSNASAFRMEADVPLLIPDVNPDHTGLIGIQRRNRGWKGFIVTNPNCTSTGLTMALRPILDAFGIRRMFAVSMQAISGAGYPGVASLDILDNVIPYIGGAEEEKVEAEPRKMLGRLAGDAIAPAEFQASAHTNRVAVSDGHTVCVSLELEKQAAPEEVRRAMEAYPFPEAVRGLPSLPDKFIEVRSEPDRPQPRKDRNAGNGMTAVVGRIRPDPVWDVKFVVLSHNTVRGAAGGALLNAELLVAQKYIGA